MKKISSMIEDKMRNFRNEMEDCPHSFISNAIIGHQLYGSINENEQENDLKERLDEGWAKSKNEMRNAKFSRQKMRKMQNSKIRN
uniref:Uncharacterized protein n=1 Tax=Meloidogyne incognita TaxID=6306 RepID=A0A914KZB2_MELIC